MSTGLRPQSCELVMRVQLLGTARPRPRDLVARSVSATSGLARSAHTSPSNANVRIFDDPVPDVVRETGEAVEQVVTEHVVRRALAERRHAYFYQQFYFRREESRVEVRAFLFKLAQQCVII